MSLLGSSLGSGSARSFSICSRSANGILEIRTLGNLLQTSSTGVVLRKVPSVIALCTFMSVVGGVATVADHRA